MKVAGSYASLLRGVSQQPPEVRQPGQHEEQVNMISDPVSGLIRRRGTIAKSIAPIDLSSVNNNGVTLQRAQGYRVHDHITEGKEYTLFLRETLGDPSYTHNSTAHQPAAMCYSRTDNAWIPMANDPATVEASNYLGRSGITTAVSAGRLIVFAVNGVQATASTSQQWGAAVNSRIVAWIRGGAYDRRYSIKLADGREIYYQTPTAGAEGAAAAISPQNIAQQLANAAAAGNIGVAIKGSHIFIDLQQEISVSDGGDGSLIRGIYNVVDDVSKLPLLAYNGQIVKVQTGPETGYYLKAVTKTTSDPWLNEARWLETAGLVQGQNVGGIFVGVIESGTMRLATSPQVLVGANIPQFQPSRSGDAITNPIPNFLRGRQITHMAMFQDRLLVVAGAAVAVSGAGDYFNFFRSTIVTVRANDGFEMIAQGGEDDYIRHSVTYSRNLVLFGDKRQYSISGTVSLTPTNANMNVMTSYAQAATVAPIAAGGQIYYARSREGSVGIHQIQPGSYVDSAESFPASAQISDYIPAPANQIAIISGAPSLLLVRSRSRPNSIYTFSYLDQPDGRKQDAWSRWDFNPLCGSLVGMLHTPDGLQLYWLRKGRGTAWYMVCDILSLASNNANFPYLDSARAWDFALAQNGPEMSTSDSAWAAAYARTHERYLIGDYLPGVPSLIASYGAADQMIAGLPFESYVTLTNPFIRDSAGQANNTGHFTVAALDVNMKESAGLKTTLTYGGLTKTYTYNGRRMGSPLNNIGLVSVETSIHRVAIGRDNRSYTAQLSALRWNPLTIVAVGWTGQSFNRTARA